MVDHRSIPSNQLLNARNSSINLPQHAGSGRLRWVRGIIRSPSDDAILGRETVPPRGDMTTFVTRSVRASLRPAESIELIILIVFVVQEILRVVVILLIISVISELLIRDRDTTLTTVLKEFVVKVALGPVLIIIILVVHPRPRSMRRRGRANLDKSRSRVFIGCSRGSGGREVPRTMQRMLLSCRQAILILTMNMRRLRDNEGRGGHSSNGRVGMRPRGLGTRDPEGRRSRQEDQFLDFKTEPQLLGRRRRNQPLITVMVTGGTAMSASDSRTTPTGDRSSVDRDVHVEVDVDVQLIRVGCRFWERCSPTVMAAEMVLCR